jgi:eukaryotic-like serine/threonine-protein kinase
MPDLESRLAIALADRYALRRELGRGGMATVYLAEDRKHRRQVAVKVLRPELAAFLGPDRFLREIEIAARLSHPHILPLHDSGEADGFLYYVMPFVEGESLRDRLNREKQLDLNQVVEITSHIAAALDYAHRQGVIHRDIKPENILLQEGEALIADFGIAFAVTAAGGDRLTNTGLALGTPYYMSPEQAVGSGQLDARSDIYSLACVVYEMLVGQPPFTGLNAQAVIARHIVDAAPPITTVRPAVGKTLARVIAKALNKAPVDRFPTATAFATALRAPASEREEIGSIAVLPLTNLSRDPEQEYFSDGMTEALIADLAKVGALKVISRTSVMRYKGSTKPLPEIARELGVKAIVEGSVLQAGDRVRITAKLIDATADTLLWGETYERELTNVLSLQGEVARAVVQHVKIKLTPQERARLIAKARVDPAAHEAYLRGRHHLNQASPPELRKAIQYFEQAIEKDPTIGSAYSGLACAYNYLGWLGGVAGEIFPKAKQAAQRAVEIDETLAEAYAVLGYTATFFDWDWAAAEQALERAIALNPNYAEGYLHYSWYLGSQDRLEEARAAITRASELDPLSLIVHANLANYYQWKRDYNGALAQTQGTLELAPNLPLALLFSGMAYWGKGRYDDASSRFETLVQVAGLGFKGYLGYSYGKAGRNELALAILNELTALSTTQYVASFQIALVLLGLGRIEETLAWLEKAFEERAGPWFPYIRQEALFDPLRDHPRFQHLVRRMNFP